jgi:hypothetical protein
MENTMRDLINLIENVLLTESRGLSARQSGEVYSSGNTDDDKISFQDLTFYPEVGSYNTPEETAAAFDRVQKKLGHPIEKINQPSAGLRAFGIAAFDTAVGTRYLAKFARDIKPVRTANTFFQTKDIPGGFSQTDARGSKEKAGYKPTDVLTDFKSQTPASILGQIGAKFTKQSPEYRAALAIINSPTFPVAVDGEGMDFKGFRDYFCEMLQPCVLINGGQVKGNAAQAAKIFMGRNGFSDCVVSFNTKVSGELYDSLLVSPEGKQIKLSSKGANGAMASSVNLLTAVRELESAGMTEFAENYPEVIEILKTIHRGDHNSGPLNLAVQFGLIEPGEIEQVMSLKQFAGNKNFDITKTNLSKNLKQLYKDRTAADPAKVVPLNHLVSSIAYKVCNEINMKTNFSNASADILNHSAFVQMYTEATSSKDGQFIIQGFNTVWPSKLFTEVTLEAEKSYSSTSSSGGKLVFSINKQPKAVANVEKGATTDAPGDSQAGTLNDYMGPDTAKLDAVSDSPRLTGPGARAAKTNREPKMDRDTLGREKRNS